MHLKTRDVRILFCGTQSNFALLAIGLVWSILSVSSAWAEGEEWQNRAAIERLPKVDFPKISKTQRSRQFYPDVWGYDYSVEPPSPLRPAELHPGTSPFRLDGSEAFGGFFLRAETRRANYQLESILDSEGRMLPWYLGYLNRFRERPFARESNEKVLRFIWVRTMDNPVCVTVKFRGANADSIYGREIVGWKIKQEKSISELTSEQKNSLKKKINDPELWKQISAEAPPRLGAKGAVSLWVLESWDGKRYRHVEHRSPKVGPVRELGKELLTLTDLFPKNPDQDY